MKPVQGAIIALLGVVLTACAATEQPGVSHPALTLDGPIEQVCRLACTWPHVCANPRSTILDPSDLFAFQYVVILDMRHHSISPALDLELPNIA